MRHRRAIVVLALVVQVAACATTSVAPAGPVAPVLSGQIFGPDGRPVEGVRVILQKPGASVPVLSAADPMVRSDTAGRFSFGDVGEGRHQLLLLYPGLGWLIAQNAQPGPLVRLVFDGKTRVIDIGRQ
jgi:hypothetical protein